MPDPEVMKILAAVGAIITDSHVVYTSGRHGSAYINKDALFMYPRETSDLCKLMAQTYNSDRVDVVAGPTMGGAILSQWVAWHLTNARSSGSTLAVYAEEDSESKERIFRRGYDARIRGQRVVVVEDVLTTGGSARKTIEAVRQLGGEILGLSVVCNRGGVRPEAVGCESIHALASVSMDSWAAEECQLCKQGVPINTAVGKGAQFLGR